MKTTVSTNSSIGSGRAVQTYPQETSPDLVLQDLKPVDEESEPLSEQRNAARPKAHEGEDDIAPDGGYGWICVAAVCSINAHTWGINNAYGIFLAHYLADNTFSGATSFEYAFIGGLSVSQALMVSPLSNIITRMWGMRTTLFIGIILQTIALLGSSFAKEVWHLFLTQGVCFGWGMGFLYIGSAGIVSQWFSTKRSLATGITAAGSGLGGVMYSLMTNVMIQRAGVDWAYRTLAVCSFVANAVCAVLVRDRNKAVGAHQTAFNHRLFAQPEVLLVLGWGVLSELGYVALLFSLPDYASSIGLTAQQGSIVGAVLNLGLLVGRPIVGHFSDAIGRLNMAGLMTASCSIICFCVWIFATKYIVLLFFALLAGMVSGTFWCTIVPVGAEVVGLKELPSAISVIMLVLVIPATFAEPIALKLRRATGDVYLDTQVFTGCMFVGAALFMWVLRAWKITQVDQVGAEKRQIDTVEVQKRAVRGHTASSAIDIRTGVKRLLAWRRV